MEVDGKPIEARPPTVDDPKPSSSRRPGSFPTPSFDHPRGQLVIRQGASDSLTSFAEMLRIPVANTFMAKGVMPFSNPLSLGTIGLKARDLPWFAFEKADVVICVGYDMVEYHPDMWNPNNDKKIIHIDALPAEVDAHYIVAMGALGDIGSTLRGIALKAKPQRTSFWDGVRNYQARNFMRDGMKKGDKVFFYHSSCPEPGIVGIASVAREAYPDATAFDLLLEPV
jgi:acetolactate synthase-1/2/3 large subunit